MDLFEAICLTIWWTEGSKLRKSRWNSFIYSVEVTNTDPLIIKTFLSYLRNRLNVQSEKIKVQLQIHDGDDQKELEKFWEHATEIPLRQFNKTIVRPVGKKVGKSQGTCKIRVHNKKLFVELTGRLDKLRGVGHR